MARGDSQNSEDKDSGRGDPGNLSGTTLKVYRFMYKEGRPLGVYEVQRGVGLSSPSVAHYHIRKLLSSGLVQEREGGFAVDKILFENMIRVRRSLIPLQTTFAIFFATTLVALVTILRPSTVSPTYFFSLIVNVVALGIFVYQTVETLRKSRL